MGLMVVFRFWRIKAESILRIVIKTAATLIRLLLWHLLKLWLHPSLLTHFEARCSHFLMSRLWPRKMGRRGTAAADSMKRKGNRGRRLSEGSVHHGARPLYPWKILSSSSCRWQCSRRINSAGSRWPVTPSQEIPRPLPKKEPPPKASSRAAQALIKPKEPLKTKNGWISWVF